MQVINTYLVAAKGSGLWTELYELKNDKWKIRDKSAGALHAFDGIRDIDAADARELIIKSTKA